MKYRLKFKSYTDPNNQGYFVRKLKVGFKGCSLLYPDMARVMNKQTVDNIFLRSIILTPYILFLYHQNQINEIPDKYDRHIYHQNHTSSTSET